MVMPNMSLQTSASSSAKGELSSLADFSKTINFGGGGFAGALPLIVLALATVWLLQRQKG